MITVHLGENVPSFIIGSKQCPTVLLLPIWIGYALYERVLLRRCMVKKCCYCFGGVLECRDGTCDLVRILIGPWVDMGAVLGQKRNLISLASEW